MRTSAIILSLASSMLLPATGNAASLLWDTAVDSCTGLNCGSPLVGGTVLNSGTASAGRWDVAIYAAAGECLRLDQTTVFGTGVDDEIVVTAPNGTVYRNDDFNGLRPRVVVRPTPSRGWYYVSIGRYNGVASPEHDFHFRYGRYVNNAANPNCASATAGQMEPASTIGKQQPSMSIPAPAAAPSAQ